MEAHKLGWRPIMKSYLASLPESFTEEQKGLLGDLFEWLVPGCLKVMKDYPLYIKFSELHLFRCLTQLFSAVMDVPALKESRSKVDTINMQIIFIFAVLWGLCSSIPEGSKKAFDVYFRNLIDGLIKGHAKPPSFKLARSNLFADQGTVFEYMINPESPSSWCRWEEQVGQTSNFLYEKQFGDITDYNTQNAQGCIPNEKNRNVEKVQGRGRDNNKKVHSSKYLLYFHVRPKFK